MYSFCKTGVLGIAFLKRGGYQIVHAARPVGSHHITGEKCHPSPWFFLTPPWYGPSPFAKIRCSVLYWIALLGLYPVVALSLLLAIRQDPSFLQLHTVDLLCGDGLYMFIPPINGSR